MAQRDEVTIHSPSASPTPIQPFRHFDGEADEEIRSAAKKYQIDPDFLKAIIAAESAGDWKKNNRTIHVSSRNDVILPYIGLWSTVADSHGIRFGSLEGNRARQIDALAKVLSDIYRDAINEMVAARWFRGEPPFVTNETSGSTMGMYTSQIKKFVHRLRNQK